MKILVANIGSTSLKWRLFDFSNNVERLLHKGGFERVTDYHQAVEDCLAELKKANALREESELTAVGFKTVIAKDVTGCVRLDKHVLQAMEDYNGLAPAHNPPYIKGIKLFAERVPQVPLIALFETAFHRFAPEASQRYAVPDSWLKIGIRRWGFHGASHKFIAERSAELLCRPDVAERARQLYVNGADKKISGAPLRVISCHLGGSSSVTGILNGASIGTSMGLSPQSGLPQNNRVGDLDSEALLYAAKTLGISVEEAQKQLTTRSGLLGLSGISNDVRDIKAAADKGDANAKLALDVFVANTRQWAGSYFLEMNGADAIVFTAGTGENNAWARAAICANLGNLGIKIDHDKNNATRAVEAIINAPDSDVKIFVIPANEELVVAREAKRFLDSQKN
jgi:acetate kinase